MTNSKVSLPRGKIYSVNEGNAENWSSECRSFFNELKRTDSGHTPYSLRYVGSMVADVHRTLLHGGIFVYPSDKKSKKGKLRLLYECFPMAFIMEKAGGLASDGQQGILDLVPKDIHERSPIALGDASDIRKFESYLNGTK